MVPPGKLERKLLSQIKTRMHSKEGAEIAMRSVTSALTVPTQSRWTGDAAAVVVVMAVVEEMVEATSPATTVD